MERVRQLRLSESGIRRTVGIAPKLTLLTLLCSLVTGCGATQTAEGPSRAETVFAINRSNDLVTFNAGRPGTISSKTRVSNLRPGENILGIDFRPANGKLYALGSSGRLYTIDPATGLVTQAGSATFSMPLNGDEFGFDFNPVVDRIRVVSNTGQNLRLHPDTGEVVDSDPKMDGIQTDGSLSYAAKDANTAQKPYVVAAAYTNNVAGAKTTTNFAIDSRLGNLVTQGTREGSNPAVSPNTGQLFTVGSLGVNTSGAVAFDIAPNNGTALVALTPSGASGSRFYLIDLNTGAAGYLGTLGGGESVGGIAVAPWADK